jgi:hypothetical protein
MTTMSTEMNKDPTADLTDAGLYAALAKLAGDDGDAEVAGADGPQERIDELETERDALREELNEIEDERDQLQAKVDEFQSEIEPNSARDELENANFELQRQIDEPPTRSVDMQAVSLPQDSNSPMTAAGPLPIAAGRPRRSGCSLGCWPRPMPLRRLFNRNDPRGGESYDI